MGKINDMKLIKNLILSSSYQLLLVIVPLITMPYLSRTLGPDSIGENSFTLAITQYFIFFAVLGTNLYGNREIAYHGNDIKERSNIFWEINFLRWITSAFVLTLFLLFVFFVRKYKELFFIQGIGIIASMFDISWYFMGRENFRVTVTRNFITKILTVISIFVFIKSPSDIIKYAFIITFGSFLGNISLWPYLKNEITFIKSKRINIRRHVIPLIGLFVPTIATQICIALNKILLGMIDNVTSVGYYTQSSQVIGVASSIVISVGVVMLPRVSKMKSENNIEGVKDLVYKTFNIASGVSVAITFGVLGISSNFAPYFFGVGFNIVGVLMMIQAPTILFMMWSNIFGTQFLLPFNRMRDYTISVTVEAVVSLMLNLILIPIIGVFGAVLATTISELILVVCQAYFISNFFSLKYFFSDIWKYFVAGIVMFLLVFWLNTSFQMNLKQLVIQIGVGTFVYVIFNIILKTQLWILSKKFIIAILNRFKKKI